MGRVFVVDRERRITQPKHSTEYFLSREPLLCLHMSRAMGSRQHDSNGHGSWIANQRSFTGYARMRCKVCPSGIGFITYSLEDNKYALRGRPSLLDTYLPNG